HQERQHDEDLLDLHRVDVAGAGQQGRRAEVPVSDRGWHATHRGGEVPRRSCFRPPRVELPRRVCPESLSDGLGGDTLGAAVFDANPDCESGGKMSGMQWGRLQVDVNCQLRRGAWYRVKPLASLNAVLDVNRQLLAVPHYLIEVVSAPPRRWSVVPRPQHPRVLPR